MSKLGKIGYLVFVVSTVILVTARLLLGGWIDYLYAPLVLSLVSFIFALGVDYKFYIDFLSMKTTKHGMNMGVLILLSLILLVAVNFLGLRFDKTFDLTKEKINSLSDQSITLVSSLKDEMKVLIFYKGRELKERARDIKNDFRLYEMQSKKIVVKIIDANRDVELAKQYLENAQAFAAVLEYKGRRAVIQPSGGAPDRPVYQEGDITSAMMKLTRDKPMTIQFLTGHGEKDIDQSSVDGIKGFADLLRNDGYNVAKLNLVMGEEQPQPDAVIAIVGPKSPYSDKELQILRDFASKGGRLFVAIDPGEKHQLALLTKSFGIEFKNNYILNETNLNEGLIGAVGVEFDANSPITKKFTSGQALGVFPFASELSRAPDAPSEYTYSDIMKSHSRSYTSNTPNAVQNPERGSHVMAMTAKNDKFLGVFFGDSDFLSDVRIGKWIHLDLAV
ncbi:MAG: GldG family protein, partial [Bdellovibrionales bacterium]|nr:GldG family protein [Bdellovibrionales bacterium]